MSRDPYRRYNRRMRRSWRNRRDAYPIPYPVPYEPYGWLVAAAVARWCYRHRSALAPFIIALGALITSAIVHTHHARWWITVTVLTIVLAATLGFPHSILCRRPAGAAIAHGLYRLWAGCGIDRAIERAYAAVVVAVTGGWLAMAIAIGPLVKPLPQVEGIGTLLVGIPWWAHRRRREKVRVTKIIDGWPALAEDIGLSGVHIASAVVDVWGWTAHLIFKKGTTTDKVISKIPDIESGLDLRPGSIRVIADPHKASRATLRVIETDPHAQPVAWPGPSVTSITQPITIGVTEDGRPVQVLILRRNVLIGGIMGSGKSGILNVLIAALAACPDVVLWGVDLKGGMELGPWADCFEKLATTPQEAIQLFRDAVAWLDDRATRKAGMGERVWEPTPEDPALIVIVDEYAELPPQAHPYADSIGRRGRAVAVNLIAATQRPTQDAMGKTAVRSQMDVRLCLRVRERRDVDLILGQGAFNTGWHAHQLSQPGAFLLSDPEHARPERNRAYLITDAQVASQAARSAPGRPTLGPPPAAPQSPHSGPAAPGGQDDRAEAEAALWAALRDAGRDGVPVVELVHACGKGRTWVYDRLRHWTRAGRVIQTIRGHWRATGPEDGQASG